MSIFFGIVFCLVGLALAVLLGLYLYREPKKELRPHASPLKVQKDLETA